MSKLRFFIITFTANLLVIGGLTILGMTYIPIITSEVWYQLKTYKKQEYSLNPQNGQNSSVFARYLSKAPVSIYPVNKDFSIVIEKIDVNAPIVANVSVSNEDSYNDALKEGVAHAVGTALPGENGNVYLFAHSSVNFFQLGKYATTFNLLRKLTMDDKVHLFYKGKDYTYQVIGKEVVEGWNLTHLTKTTLEPVLTLQTCDPPGTTFNRLVVTARLLSVN